MDMMDYNEIATKIEKMREIIDDLRDAIDFDSDAPNKFKEELSEAVFSIEEGVDSLDYANNRLSCS